MLILLSLMQKKILGAEGIFSLGNFVPRVTVFGLTFISLFAGVLISNDRDSSFLTRLFTSPLTGFDYIYLIQKTNERMNWNHSNIYMEYLP